jgi:hypothetical protein
MRLLVLLALAWVLLGVFVSVRFWQTFTAKGLYGSGAGESVMLGLLIIYGWWLWPVFLALAAWRHEEMDVRDIFRVRKLCSTVQFPSK